MLKPLPRLHNLVPSVCAGMGAAGRVPGVAEKLDRNSRVRASSRCRRHHHQPFSLAMISTTCGATRKPANQGLSRRGSTCPMNASMRSAQRRVRKAGA